MALVPSSHWMVWNASDRLPIACILQDVDSSDEDDWQVSTSAFSFADYASADCPQGYQPAPRPPLNGYSNSMLWKAASGRRIWINASTTISAIR